MTNWLTPSLHPIDERVAKLDPAVDRQLRRMDIVLALIALALLALPMALALLLGRLRGVETLGRQNRLFQRWDLRFPDSWAGRLLARTGIGATPVLFNILRGDLAWVGHKPIAATAGRDYPVALAAVRPGLVSIWDLRQRTAVDFGSALDADLEYLSQRGLRHDLALLLRAPMVLWMPLPGALTEARICVGDVSFDNVNREQALQRIEQMLDGAQAQQVSFVNPACVNIASRDRGYRRLLGRAALVLPDGIGIKIAADLLGLSLKQNVNGTDLFPRLCELFERRDASVYLLGGQSGVAERVAQEIRARWPKLRIAGLRDGFFSVAQEGEVAAQVCASGALSLIHI